MKTLSIQLLETQNGQIWSDALNGDGMCDIQLSSSKDTEFIGFTDIYYHLSQIIPKSRIIVDLGCAYAPQAFYFQEHKKYIGVDISDCPKLKTNNSEYHKMKIEDWIKNELPKYDQEELFGIINYVPPWGGDNMKAVRESFKHCFSFYCSSYDFAAEKK